MSFLHDSLLPWHASLWPALMSQSSKNGGLLLSGPGGHGKRHLARRLSQALLCEQPHADGQPCGQCAGCLLFRANQHPDFVEIVTEQHWDDFVRLRTEGSDGGGDGAGSGDSAATSSGGDREQKVSRDIRIVDIRKLERLTTLSAHRAGRRVVLIWPADEMTTEASNALLKTLEEPGQGLHFILVSAHAGKLLPTVRSRVRVQECPGADIKQARAWLVAQGVAEPDIALGLSTGAPLKALALAADADSAGDSLHNRNNFIAWLLDRNSSAPTERPAAFDKLGLGVVLQLVLLTGSELLRAAQGAGVKHLLHFNDALMQQAATLRNSPAQQSALHRLLKTCLDFMPHAEHPLNVRMQLDDLLQDWFAALKRKTA